MSDIKELIPYFKVYFGEGVYDELERDFYMGFKRCVRTYCRDHNIVGKDEDRLSQIYLWYQMSHLELPNYEVITEVEEGRLTTELIIDRSTSEKELSKKELLSRAGCTLNIGSYIFESQYFIEDILCRILYETKMEYCKQESVYCELARNEKEKSALKKYRNSGRKKEHVDNAKKIEMFSDYGYALPIDIPVKVEKGSATMIADVVPNVFRVFLLKSNFKKLYKKRDLDEYESKKLLEILSTEELTFSLLERYKLEEILKLNLAVSIEELIRKHTMELTQKEVIEWLSGVIKEFIAEANNGPGVYSKIMVMNILKELRIPDECYRRNVLEEISNKLKYYTEVLHFLNSSIYYEYEVFYLLLKSFFEEKGMDRKNQIELIENKWIVSIKCDKGICKDEILNIQSDYHLRDEVLHSVIQKELIYPE